RRVMRNANAVPQVIEQEQPASSNGTNTKATTSHELQISHKEIPVTANSKAESQSEGAPASIQEIQRPWFKIDFFLGVLTTFLVTIAWSTNLVTKPLATGFGGGVAVLGMAIAYLNYIRTEKAGRIPVLVVVT